MRKNRKINILLVAIPSFFILGCATTENYEAILNQWVGKSESELVTAWGIPKDNYKLDDGGKILLYSNSHSVETGGYSYTMPQTTYRTETIQGTPVYSRDPIATMQSAQPRTYQIKTTENVTTTVPKAIKNYSCETRFHLDNKGIVKDWKWQGNDCVSY